MVKTKNKAKFSDSLLDGLHEAGLGERATHIYQIIRAEARRGIARFDLRRWLRYLGAGYEQEKAGSIPPILKLLQDRGFIEVWRAGGRRRSKTLKPGETAIFVRDKYWFNDPASGVERKKDVTSKSGEEDDSGTAHPRG